jgi:hypothetical protein
MSLAHTYLRNYAIDKEAQIFWNPYQKVLTTTPLRALNRVIYGLVMDQGQHGDCAAVSSEQARVSAKKIAGLAIIPLSYFAQYGKARQIMGTTGQDSGETIEACMQVWEQFGGVSESIFPDTENDFDILPPDSAWDPNWKLNLSQVLNISTLDEYKDAIARGIPVLVAFDCFDEIESGTVANTGWLQMPQDPTKSIGGHMVNGIGYDDDLGAVLLLNQWGSNWGIKDSGLEGCFWMPYEYFNQYVSGTLTIMPDNGVQPVPQPIPAPFAKPVLDTYSIQCHLEKNIVAPNVVNNFIVTVYKNGSPLPGETVDIQINQDDNTVWETTYITDSNGTIVYPVKFDKICSVAAIYHYYDPYGNLHADSSEAKVGYPVVYPKIKTDVVITQEYSGVIFQGSSCVSPELWQLVGQPTKIGNNLYTVNNKNYPGVEQDGKIYINWKVMTDNGYSINGLIGGGWVFKK